MFHEFMPRLVVVIVSILMVGSAVAIEPTAGTVAPNRLILAHYLPWYATEHVSGRWGRHWTMNRFDPSRITWDGRREAASGDYPLIGLYDSSDDDLLECQVLLMKFAGLDGVSLDWYGTNESNDCAANHRNAQKLITWLKKAGLRFAICYEDQALKQLAADDDLKQGARDLQWAEKHWFGDDAYVKQDGRPILLIFGPRHFNSEKWSQLRAVLTSKPLIFVLPQSTEEFDADGIFGWPPVWGDKSPSPEPWRKELDRLYARQDAGESVIATAFPGFNDIYREAGLHDSSGRIDHRHGATFAETLTLALGSRSSIVQIASWNGYGEGTAIEPTRTHGYRFLEQLQKSSSTRNSRNSADLRLPTALYQLRKRSHGDRSLVAELNEAAEMLFAGKTREAEAALAKVGNVLGHLSAIFADAPSEADDDYRLTTDLLYREDKNISDAMRLRCRLDVYVPAKIRPFSTVVWFHGGGLTEGERFIPLPLRRQGVGVVSVNYRLAPGVKSPAFLEDAAAAVAWTFKHIGDFGGSADRVFVSGHSAGGYLTAMIGLDKRWLAVHDIDANHIAGLIPLSPQMITHFAIRAERGIHDTQPVVDDLAPLFHVRKDAPPMLLMTGDREQELLGRYEENAYFQRMMKVVGYEDMEFHELPGYNHGDMPEPSFPALLEFISKRNRSAAYNSQR